MRKRRARDAARAPVIGAILTMADTGNPGPRGTKADVGNGIRMAGALQYAARPGPAGSLENAWITAVRLSAKLNRRVDDRDRLLDRLVTIRAAAAHQVVELLCLLEAQLPNFKGRPTLRVTKSDEEWIRASDTFDGPLMTPGYRARTADASGRYLARNVDRDESAVLMGWNQMDMVDHQLIPAKSIILEGPAASQSVAGAPAKRGEFRPGGGLQAFHAGTLLSGDQVTTEVSRVDIDSKSYARNPFTGKKRLDQ